MNIWMRFCFAVLVFSDRLLGTHLVEREMARLQHRVETFEAQASAIRQQMEELNHLLHVVQVQLCVLYLCHRHDLRSADWLRFAPAEDADEERRLDLLIGRLVRHGLATVRTEMVADQTYVYHLRPDWAAIVDLLSAWEGLLDPVTASWLDEIRRSNGNNGEIRH